MRGLFRDLMRDVSCRFYAPLWWARTGKEVSITDERVGHD